MKKAIMTYYFTTMLILICFFVFTIIASYLVGGSIAFILALAIGLFATTVCIFINLLYFIPIKNNLELLLPGFVCVFLVLVFSFPDFSVDFAFFSAFALVNLISGTVWYRRMLKK